ncbi:adenine glycosylase [Denitrobacterium detoxificans]|uniref:A/G-specific DNA-adenine glycosylase n=1 Tax=Denitrobacterium detoxificans TaxID=79604 RepID=A0A172RXW2_9ACTN|nr:adenine glycosylase [Denitrobacterium detoxificans]ANE22558.1 adenine glycosylase [Denitrobacterium detoxificans]SEO99973.1 A/G-specific DNA-adenine glycosylase [Denitrobacterium detoxificans]
MLSIAEFQDRVYEAGRLYEREGLPWRYIDDPYAVYLSEVMLQQTQVKRVLEYWPRFLDAFPTVESLALAEPAAVLGLWQGLGYNRRALSLLKCAKECVERFDSALPTQERDLLSLPGIGPSTAAGIISFAHNRPSVYIETNVRTVFIDQFFPEEDEVHDKQIEPLVRESCPQDDARRWYYALLDWGAHIKQTKGNASRRSKSYTRQSRFEGSRRQKRAFVVRELLSHQGIPAEHMKNSLDAFEVAAGREATTQELFDGIVSDLQREGFLRVEGGRLFS